MYPEGLLYTKEHEWVRMEGSSATCGFTEYAQSQLVDVVYVELPSVGTSLEQMKPFGVVESVKAVSDLYSPLSGVVAEANEALIARPELVNEDPYGAGWMLKIRPSSPTEPQSLLNAAGYQEFISSLEKEG
ncbi:MAG: glycine cleavage system protein GcvH [Chloroflexota bacterium]|nr:glycine cleavage system protein GcvH [Chloroflexota bacterium]